MKLKTILIAFFIVLSVPFGGAFAAETCPVPTNGKCEPGCKVSQTGTRCTPCEPGTFKSGTDDALECTKCPAGSYCATEKLSAPTAECPSGSYCPAESVNPTNCPSGYTYGKPALTAENKCVKNCPNKDLNDSVDNNKVIGDWAPDKDTVTYSNKCKYSQTDANKLTCKNDSGNGEVYDANGYHKVGTTCVLNNLDCDVNTNAMFNSPKQTGTGKKYWDYTGSEFSECIYEISCKEGFHFSYIYCNPNTIDCSARPLSLSNGTATWIQNTSNNDSIFANWNKSDCYKSVDNNTTFGTGGKICNYTSGSSSLDAEFNTNCREFKMTSCIAGYYHPNSDADDCIPTDQGYYSPTGKITQTACPVGMTSTPPATAQKECFYKGKATGTKFCDNNGCFYLPDDVRFGS